MTSYDAPEKTRAEYATVDSGSQMEDEQTQRPTRTSRSLLLHNRRVLRTAKSSERSPVKDANWHHLIRQTPYTNYNKRYRPLSSEKTQLTRSRFAPFRIT
jgi:hypothetical protein